MPTLPIAYVLAFNGPPKSGVVSVDKLIESTVNKRLLGSVKSTEIPVPAIPFIVMAVPAELVTGILSAPNVSGVSLNEVKPICPPCPNTAYNSVKFSLDLLNASLILSPVPSFPSIPILINCLAIYPIHIKLNTFSTTTSTLGVWIVDLKL